MAGINVERASEAISQLADILAELGEFINEHEILVRIQDEYEIEEKLLEEEMYKTVVIRQSTFFESFLTSVIKIKVEESIDREISNSEEHFLNQGLNPRGKVYLADWFGQIDSQVREALLELMSIRGQIAHEAWVEMEEQEEENLKRIANRIHDQIENILESDYLLPD